MILFGLPRNLRLRAELVQKYSSWNSCKKCQISTHY